MRVESAATTIGAVAATTPTLTRPLQTTTSFKYTDFYTTQPSTGATLSTTGGNFSPSAADF